LSRPFWNWKSAVLSISMRTPVFMTVAATMGGRAIAVAALIDISFRTVVAGFSGALTQYLSTTKRRRLAALTVVVFVPAGSQAAESLIHWGAGTPHLTIALAVSGGMTMASSAFDLYAMRRGVFVVGGESAGLTDDLLRVPTLIRGAFLAALRRPDLTKPSSLS
jgi:hypothetical protein